MNSHVSPAASVAWTTFFAIFVVGAATWGGYALSTQFSTALLSSLLKYSTGIIGAIWLFSVSVYNKLSDVTDISGLDYKQHRHIEVEVRSRLQWFWLRALVLGVLALIVVFPSIVIEVKLPVAPWMVAAGFGGLALSLFSLRRIWIELEDIRQLKSYIKEIERAEKERAEQVKELKAASKEEWEPDSALGGFLGEADNPQNKKK